jgi:hypothetical protein
VPARPGRPTGHIIRHRRLCTIFIGTETEKITQAEKIFAKSWEALPSALPGLSKKEKDFSKFHCKPPPFPI